MSLIISVSIKAGATAFERMPERAYSFASDFVNVMSPAFEAEYAAAAVPPPVLPALEPTATMRPNPDRFIAGTARRAQRKAPVRLTSS